MKNHVISGRTRSFIAVVASLALVGAMAISTAPPALAAEPGAINASQTVTKTSLDDDGVVAPGETFSYRLDFSCGTSIAGVSGCGSARITDVLPQWLELVSVGPFPTAAPGTSSVTKEDGRDRIALDFTAPVDVPSRTTGLPLGGFTMQITVRLSADAPWEIDGTTLTNVASMTSVNAADSSGSADIVAKVPRRLAATATKSFSPDQNFNTPGQQTDVALGATNTTNGGVDTLSIQDPAGSPSAGPDSPFFYLAFEDFGAVVPPSGADSVRAEVWTPSAGWTTVYSGASPPVYPDSGAPARADVHGVRLTWSSSTPGGIARGAVAGATLSLAQRATVAGLPPTTVTNPATAGVGLAGDAATSAVASDEYRIVPFGIQVNATKTFDPDRIRAGESTTVRLSASNTGTAPLSVLRVSEPGAGTSGALSDELTFTGFATGVQWPDGATSARIEYRFADGTTSAPSTTTTVDSLPAVPSGAGRVVGFDIDFLASGAPGIAAGAEARVPFTATTSRPTPLPDVVQVPNEVAVSGTSLADPARTASTTASDTLEIFGDRIGVGVSKVVTPGQAWLLPGQSVIAQIPATVSAFPATTVDPTRVVVDDASALSPGWWNLYDATELTQLGIPANGALTVQYTTDGSTYTDLPGAVGLTAPPAFRSIAIPPALSADIVGLRFVYDALPGETFSPGTTLQPNVTFTTRAITRDGTPIDEVTPNATIPDATAPGGQRPVVQAANCAAAGARQDPLAITATTAATDPCPTVVLVPTTGGPGPDLVDKDLTPRALVERSQATGTATLRWSTGGLTGVRSQTITETGSTSFSPATTDRLTTSFFDSFDLVRIPAITTASDPRMRYDRVASIELFDSTTGTWSALSGAPWDGPRATNGTVFPGYTLTDAQRATTTGVRFTIEESPDRASVLTPGDLTQPAVGSGVTSSTERRSIPLDVILRDQRRGDGTPVLAGEGYNSADPGVVTNTVESEACLVERSGGACADGLSSRDAAALTILDGTATITTGKTWTGGPLGLPPSSTPLQDYPTSRATLTVVNNGPQKVDAISLADPAPNTVSAGSAYDAFDLDRIVSVSTPTGATATSLVLRYADGSRSAALTVDEARALDAAQLSEVVGVEAASTGRIGLGRTNGRLEVVVDLRLRQTLRSDPSTPVPAPSRVPNTVFGSISDPSVEAAGSCAVSDPMIAPPAATVIGCASAELALVQNQDRTVVASKSLSPAQQFENEDQRITATLAGTPGGTARSTQVELTDDSAAFWNAYGFAGLSSQFAIASPANRVKVEVLTGVQYSVDPDNTLVPAGGTWRAVTGVSGSVWKTAAQARSALPDGGPLTMVGTEAGLVQYSQVQGVRVTFQRVAAGSISDPAARLLLLENPATPTLTARILVDRRDALLTGGPVPTTLAGSQPAPGTTEAGRYPNTVVATASGVAGNGPTVSDDATADMMFRHLPTRATVEKTPAGQVQPGVPFTVTLRSTNSGAYPIIDPVIVDSLPVGDVVAGLPDLVFPAGVDPTDPSTYSVSLTGGTGPGAPWTPLPSSSSGLSVEVTRSGGASGEPIGVRFSFAGGSALGLGQSYAISFPMQLRPGSAASQTFVNRFSLDGERAFDACNGNGPLRETCETQAAITVQPLASLEMHQEVRADDAELGVVSSTTQVCTPADATADGFYRAPCVPVTKPGATDTWRLQYRNTGSYPLGTVSSIVYLPELGSSGIDIPSARSDWRATLSSMLALRAADNPTALLNVRYSTVTPGTALCDAVLNPNGSCAPGYWRPLDASVDLSTVTALYVTVDFASLSDALAPDDTFSLTFTTRAPANAPAPQTNPITWNSVKSGATYTASGTQTLLPFEVPVVGAALATGSVSLVKSVDGPAAAADWVPGSFSGTLACESAGQDVPASALPAVPALTAGEPVQVDGLPWGAQCSFVEAEAGSAVTLSPDRVTAVTPPAVVAQQSITNTYRYASLEVGKKVTAATGFPVPTGFGFTARCEYLGAVVLDERFLLDADQTREFTGLPARAACTVTETDPRGADSTVAAAVVTDPLVAPVIDQDARTVTIPELSPDTSTAPQNAVSFDNLYGVGALILGKSLVGGAADQFGAGKTFSLDVVCTFGGETLVDTTVPVSAATGWSASVTGVIAGSECRVAEPDLEGADAVILAPNDGVVVVPAVGTASVLVTNRYLAGSLQVTKVLAGEGAAAYGTGSFTFSLACVRDGEDVVIPGGGERTVDVRSPVADYSGLASGAECTLRETDSAGAGESVILDARGSVLAGDEGYTFTVVVDPTAASDADQPQPPLTVRNTFRLAEVSVSKSVQSSAVDAAGAPLPYGPFTVDLSCTFEGSVVSAVEPMSRSIAAGETLTWTGLPQGALCRVDETDGAGAARTTVDVTEGGRSTGPVAGDGAVLAALPSTDAPEQTSVTFSNAFDVSTLSVSKSLEGSGASSVARTFPVHVLCTLVDATRPAGQVVRDVRGDIGGSAGATLRLADVPAGAVCAITETDTGGAASTSVTTTAADGTVTRVQASSASVVLTAGATNAVITNRFEQPLAVTGTPLSSVLPAGAVLALIAGGLLLLCRPRRREV